MNLTEVGIKEGSICETIVTTFHEDGEPNAAPMGVKGLGGNDILMRVHSDTDTYTNIMGNGSCVVNIVFDPLLFLRCALYGKHKGSGEIESSKIQMAESLDAPYLEDAHAYLYAELKDVEEIDKNDSFGYSNVAKMTLTVTSITVLSPYPIVPNRGFFASIELAIALSRGLSKDVHRYLMIIKKTLPKGEFELIEDFVNSYLGVKP